MKDIARRLYNLLPPFLRNQYLLAIIMFIIWVLLFDNNNLIDRYHNIKALRQLQTDREYYMMRIEEDRRKLNELRTNNENLEKFAREEYYMKREDEDIYMVVTRDEERADKKRVRRERASSKRDSRQKQ